MTIDPLPADNPEEARERGGSLIAPAADTNDDLDTLVAMIRDNRLHDLEGWGSPVGAEAW